MTQQVVLDTRTRYSTLWLSALRIVVTVHLTAVLVEAALAGFFLSGSHPAVYEHELMGVWIGRLCLLQLAIAIVLWRIGRASVRPALYTLALLASEALQIFSGFRRILPVHVPLALLIFGGLISMTIMTWRSPETITGIRA